MMVKIVCSLQAGNLEEFESLIGVVGGTLPAPDAAAPWVLCTAIGIILLELLGRARAANHLFHGLAAGVGPTGDAEPIASAFLHGLRAFRMAQAEDDPMKGLEHGEAFLHITEATGHRRHQELAKIYIGMNRWYLGALAGTDHMLANVTLSEDDTGMISAHRPFVLAWLLADLGSFDEALLWAGRLVETGKMRQVPVDEGRGHWVLAEVLRRAGELDGADVAIGAALAILRLASHLDTPGALATLAALRLAQGRIAEALAAAGEGLEKYEAMTACGFFRGGFLRWTHARCLEAAGDHEAAKAAIAAARARLFTIAAKIGDPTYRKSFLEAVPENRQTLELARRWVGPDESN